MVARFRDRVDAGRALAAELRRYADDPDVRVLALPRGGVPVGYEVARALRVPLDVFIVRKLGLPWHEELAMGAIASGGIVVLDEDLVRRAGVSGDELASVIASERRELERRERRYRGDRTPPDILDRTVILVDDGLATGASMRAAVAAVRQEGPRRVVVAVPIASPETCAAFREEVDEAVCARNMLGERVAFDDVPFFWSAHYGTSINYVGHAELFTAEVDGDLAAQDAMVRLREAVTEGDAPGAVHAVVTLGRDRVALEAEVAMERAART